MNTRPTPRKAKVVRKSTGDAVVNLMFDAASAAACQRCSLCTAKRGRGKDKNLSCSVEMPPASVPSFLWGSRVDAEAVKAISPPAADPAPEESRKPRRPRSTRRLREALRETIIEVRSALAAERASNEADDTFPDDPEASDAHSNRVLDRTHEALERLADLMVKIHGDEICDYDSLEPVATETDDAIVVAIPGGLAELAGSAGCDVFALAIPKDAIVKLTTKPRSE